MQLNRLRVLEALFDLFPIPGLQRDSQQTSKFRRDLRRKYVALLCVLSSISNRLGKLLLMTRYFRLRRSGFERRQFRFHAFSELSVRIDALSEVSERRMTGLRPKRAGSE